MIPIEWKPAPKQLRTFGLTGALVAAILGLILAFRGTLFGVDLSPQTARTTAMCFFVASGLILVLGLGVPRWLRPLYVVLNVIALPIGWVLSHVILLAVYFGVMMPIGLILRLVGRDPLHRSFDPQGETYWTPVEPHPPARRYFRQF